jgi:hypothetical protein
MFVKPIGRASAVIASANSLPSPLPHPKRDESQSTARNPAF